MDYLVIGAGPAGLQLAWFLGKAGRDYLVLEAGSTPGTFYRTFPRHRRMISINKPHTGWDDPELNLRMDWNSLLSDDPELLFTRYTDRYFPDADDYVRYLADFAATHQLRVAYDTKVTRIARSADHAGAGRADGRTGIDGTNRDGHGRLDGTGGRADAHDPSSPGDGFLVTDQRGEVRRARRVVVATGFGRVFVPPIPGVELTEQYATVSVDPDDFVDQRVLIVGKGNSAFETAAHLVERAAVIHVVGPRSINFAWRTHFVGHLRAINNTFLDSYQLKSQNMVLDATIEQIERQGSELVVTMRYARRDKTVQLTYDRVITCTGFAMDTSIFDASCRPALAINDRFPALTSQWESVDVPDLYFAGTLTQSRDFKKYSSAFIKGFRYSIRALQRMLDRRYHRAEWPRRELPADASTLADAVLARVNRTSGLWQQYSFLCDVVELGDAGEGGNDGDGSSVRWYEEVPVDHVLDGGFGVGPRFVTVSLEYGPGHDAIDPFDVDVGREWEADPFHPPRYLHPVVRLYDTDVDEVEVLHLPEDVCNVWSGEAEYHEPLTTFLAAALREPAAGASDAVESPPVRA